MWFKAEQLESIWNHRRTALWLVLLFAASAIALIVWVPAPGISIAVLAVGAALMSLRLDMSVYEKAAWMLIVGLLLVSEVHAILKDRRETQHTQQDFQLNETDRLLRLVQSERDISERKTKQLIEQENASFSSNLRQDQVEFEGAMHAIVASHRQDQDQFAGVLGKQQDLLQTQLELSEQINGHLVPDRKPSPTNACTGNGTPLPNPNDITVEFNGNAVVAETLPLTILSFGDFPVLSVDKVEETQDIALKVDFRDARNMLALRVDGNGLVNRAEFPIVRPDKSTFLVLDAYGNDFFRAHFLNPHYLKVTGEIMYCGIVYSRFLRDNCEYHISGASFVIHGAPTCPKPPQ